MSKNIDDNISELKIYFSESYKLYSTKKYFKALEICNYILNLGYFDQLSGIFQVEILQMKFDSIMQIIFHNPEFKHLEKEKDEVKFILIEKYDQIGIEKISSCDYEESNKYLILANSILPSHNRYYAIGNNNFYLKNYYESLKNYNFAIFSLEIEILEYGFLKSAKQYAKLLASKIIILNYINRSDEAENLAIKSLEDYPLDKEINFALGFTYYSSEKYDEAIEQFLYTNELSPSENSLFYLAEIYFYRCKYSKALKYYLKSLEISEKFLHDFENILFAIDKISDKNFATEICEKFHEKTKKFEFLEKKCEIFLSLGLNSEAILCYNQFKTSNLEELAQSFLNLAKIYLNQNSLDLAYEKIIIAREICTKNNITSSVNLNSKFILGEIFLIQKDLDNSKLIAEDLIENSPDFWGGFLLKSKIFQIQYNFDESLKYLDKAIDLKPFDKTLLSLKNILIKILVSVKSDFDEWDDFEFESEINYKYKRKLSDDFSILSEQVLSSPQICPRKSTISSISSENFRFFESEEIENNNYLVVVHDTSNLFDI